MSSLELQVAKLKKRYQSDTSIDYKYSISNFARDVLGITLWDSVHFDSQLKIANCVMLSYLKQEESQQVLLGELAIEDCNYYIEGEVIQTVVDVQSGHGTGKSYLSAIISLWLYTVYDDSVIYTFSPNKNQAVSILWRDIRTLHATGSIKGKALELVVKGDNPSNFIAGRVAPTGKSQDTTSVHGLHAKVFCAIVDEAQHYKVGLYDGLDSVMSGGLAVMLLSSNPKSASAPARRYRVYDYCANFTLSALNHPNVYYGQEIIPGGVSRDYVLKLLQGCEPTSEHNQALNTFTIDWLDDPTQIYIPSSQFSWRVLGVPSSNSSGNTFFSATMIEDALDLPLALDDSHTIARIGVDVARFGSDDGVIYFRHKGEVRLHTTISRQDGNEYVRQLGRLLDYLLREGVSDVQIRLDSTGGYGSTIEDTLNKNHRWSKKFDYFEIVPVNFRNYATASLRYSDIVTEMYAETAIQLTKGLRYRGYVPDTLITELTNRTFDYVPVTSAAIKRLNHYDPTQLYKTEVKRISKKIVFKNEFGYSPDNSDALCLCAAPDWVFTTRNTIRTTTAPVQQLHRMRNAVRRRVLMR